MLYHKPSCPKCNSVNVKLVKSSTNIMKIVIYVIIGIFFGDIFPLEWKCDNCGSKFMAVGDNIS